MEALPAPDAAQRGPIRQVTVSAAVRWLPGPMLRMTHLCEGNQDGKLRCWTAVDLHMWQLVLRLGLETSAESRAQTCTPALGSSEASRRSCRLILVSKRRLHAPAR